MPILPISFRGRLGLDELEWLCGVLGLVRSPPRQAELAFDCSGLHALGAAPLALLAATLRAGERDGICDPLTHYAEPRAAGIDPFCGAAGLPELLGADATNAEWPAAPGGCQAFSSRDAIFRASAALRHHLQLPADGIGPLPAIGNMAEEISRNVLQHARAGEGVAAATLDDSGRQFELAVADCGIGIRASLQRNSAYSDLDDDLDALHVAISPQVTGEEGSSGGMGLFLARMLAKQNGGRLILRSGDARLEVDGDRRAGRRDLTPLPGTLVVLRGFTDQPFNLLDLDDRLRHPAGATGGG